jgi:hypothetical protein
MWNKTARMLCLEQVREILSIPSVYRRVVVRYNQVPHVQSPERGRPEKSVYFDLRDNTFHRYLYCLIKFFDLVGMKVLIRKRIGFLGRISLFSEMIVDLPNVFLVTDNAIGSQLEVCQSGKKEWNGRGVLLSDDYFSAGEVSGYHVPMCMHPDVYHLPIYQQRSFDRGGGTIRLSFAGNVNPAKYSSPLLARLFAKLSRVEVVNTVIQAYPDKVILPHTRGEWQAVKSAEILMAIDPRAYLDGQEFMEMLGQSDFYLSPPGVTMPLCHNVVEAMFMGAVPVLQYPEFFDPPLQDNVNCIVFRDRADLIRRVAEILQMAPVQVAELRRQAMQYYDRHLAPESVVGKIMERGDKLRAIYLLSEQGSVEKLRKRKERSCCSPKGG